MHKEVLEQLMLRCTAKHQAIALMKLYTWHFETPEGPRIHVVTS